MKTDKKRKDPAEPFSLPSETGDPFPDDDDELRENERFRQGILEAWETYCADSLKGEYELPDSAAEEEDYEILMADSVEELLSRIEDWNFNFQANNVETPEETFVGHNIDFKA